MFLVTHWYCSAVVPHFFLIDFYASQQNVGDSGSVAMSIIYVPGSVANNFVHLSTAVGHGYHLFGELARFNFSLLQKIKKASSLPLVEQCEDYVNPNDSRFHAIDETDFFLGRAYWPLWTKLEAIIWGLNFAVMRVASLRNSWIVCFPK